MKRFTKLLPVAAGLVLVLSAVTLTAAADPRETAAAAAEAARLAPDDAAAQFRSAQAFAAAGEAEPAFAAARRAVELAPDDVTYLRGLAQLASWVGAYETAHDAWRRLLAARGEDREASLGVARTAAWAGRTDAAVRLYRRHVERYPDDADARLEYARVTAWQGNAAAALEILDGYRRDFGPSARYEEDRAMVLTAAERAAAALEILAPLVESDPESPRRQRLYTMALSEGDRPAQALDHLETVIRLEPESPATREAERVVATPLRSTVTPLFDLYNDSDDVEISRLGLEGGLALGTRTRLTLGASEEELRADAGSGLAAPGGATVRGSAGWLGLSHRFSPRARVDARLGEAGVDGGADLTTYRLSVRLDPSDALGLDLERDRGFYAVSPRALDLGVHRTGDRLRLDWSPGPRYRVEASAAYDDFSDGNRRWDLSLAPRRQVLRRQRFNLDLGLRGWWFAFDRDPGTGYYSPGSYERYSGTAFGYWKLSEQNGLGFVLSLGWFQDDTMDSFRFGGDLALEGTFGIYGDWMLTVRGGATENSRLQSGAFSAYGGSIALTRRFGRPRPSYVSSPPSPPTSPVTLVAETEPVPEDVVTAEPAAPETAAAAPADVVAAPSEPMPAAEDVVAAEPMPAAEDVVAAEPADVAAPAVSPAPEPSPSEPSAPEPSAATVEARTIFELQLALFHYQTNADVFVRELGAKGFQPYLVEVLSSRGEPRYTVRIGPYASMDEAELRAAELRDELQLATVIRYRSVSR